MPVIAFVFSRMGLDVPSAALQELDQSQCCRYLGSTRGSPPPSIPQELLLDRSTLASPLRGSQPGPLEDGRVSTRHVGEFRGLKSTGLQGAKAEKR